MALEGDVKSDDLVNLLQVLTLQRRMGVLCLRSQKTGHSTRILIGEIGVAAEGGSDFANPGLLASEGLVPPDEVEAAYRECRPGTDLMIAVRSRPNCAPHIDAWRRACRRERLLAVFESGPWRFVLEEREVPPSSDLVPVDFIVLEAARREDESRTGRRLPTSAVLRHIGTEGSTPVETWILRSLNGHRTLHDVAIELGLPPAIVLESSSRLVEAGLAKRLTVGEIVDILHDPDSGLTLANRAALWREVIHGKNCRADFAHEAATDLASSGFIYDAVTCWRLAASGYRQSGDKVSAARCLLAAHDACGSSPKLLARALRLAADAKLPHEEVERAAELAVRLARTLDAAGGGGVAFTLLESVSLVDPNRYPVLVEASALAIRHRLHSKVVGALARQLRFEESHGHLPEACETAARLSEHDPLHRRDRQIKLNVLRVRLAIAKRIEQGRRVMRRGAVVGLALALGWTTWAYRGESQLASLNGGAVTPEDLRAAAGSYFLVPAGFELRARARELERNEVATRASAQQREVANTQATELATRQAFEALERGRFALDQGDLETASKEYRVAALIDSAHRSVAQKELADVERELREGLALIRAANTAESINQHRDAHALRLRALAQHPNVPAVRSLTLNVRLIADPGDRITVPGYEGNGVLDFQWDKHQDLSVHVEGSNGLTRVSTLRWPPASIEIPVFHEPGSLKKLEVGGGIAFISPTVDRSGVLITLRSGSVIRLDEKLGEVAKFVPTSLESPKIAAVESGQFVLAMSSSGRGRILNRLDLTPITTLAIQGDPKAVFPAPSGFWVMTSDDMFEVTNAGVVARVGESIKGLVDFAVDGDLVTGVPVGGGLVEFSLPSGKQSRTRFLGEDVRAVGCGFVAHHGIDSWWTLLDPSGRAVGGLSPIRSQFLVLKNSIVVARPDGAVEFLARP